MAERPDKHVAKLLRQLNSAEAGVAWATFIDRYAPLITTAVRQFEFEQDRANDCFLYVCEKLYQNGFRRLLKFDTGGAARFSNWLGTVVFNLCVDWHRQEFGRAQMLPALSALPAFDRSVYGLYYEKGLDREHCLQLLRDEFPDLTREQVAGAIDRVWRALTPRQRWQWEVRAGRRHQRSPGRTDAASLADPAPGPDQASDSAQQRERLLEALRGLPADQRMLLQMRYVQGLSYKQIARLIGVADPFRANRALKAAEQALQELLSRESVAKP